MISIRVLLSHAMRQVASHCFGGGHLNACQRASATALHEHCIQVVMFPWKSTSEWLCMGMAEMSCHAACMT